MLTQTPGCTVTTALGSSESTLWLCRCLQELNNRLAAEISRLRTLLTGDAGGEAAGSPLTQGKDAYELEAVGKFSGEKRLSSLVYTGDQ